MATRADVAKLAGVSTSTVSYALSGERPISKSTRLRIEAAMRELGYTPNALASGLAGRRSRIIALLFPSGPRIIATTDMEYVIAAADAARERGYNLVVWTTGDSALDEVHRLSGTGLVDGVLLMEVLLQDERVHHLQAAGVPLALAISVALVDPFLADLAILRPAQGVGVRGHQRVGECLDHLPQQIGTRRGQVLLQPGGERHTLKCGHRFSFKISNAFSKDQPVTALIPGQHAHHKAS